MLTRNQDPTGLSARVAFHLHRLNLTGTALRCRSDGILTQRTVTALSNARLQLTGLTINQLAGLLSLDVSELTRPLSADEAYEWAVYRASSAHRDIVWANAHSAWTTASLSIKDAAAIMKLSRSLLHRQVRHDVPANTTLTWPSAQRLAFALNHTTDRHPFLPARFQARDLI